MEIGSQRISDLRKRPVLSGVLFFAFFIGLYLADRGTRYHLLFHSVAELFSIVVAAGIFMISWNTRRFTTNRYLVFLGLAFFFIGILDLLHTFSFRGMNIFTEDGTDTPTQYWIAARYLHALSFLAAPAFFTRRLRTRPVLALYAFLTAAAVLSISVWNVFPTAHIEGIGLTRFKLVSEYLIILFFLASIPLLFRHRGSLSDSLLWSIVGSILTAAVSELFFTFYIDVADIQLVIGHFMKIISYYILYKAVIETTLWEPYGSLFRGLETRSKELARQTRLLENSIEALTHPFYVIDTATYTVEKANSAAYSLAGDGDCRTCHAMTHRRSTPCDTDSHPCPLRIVVRTGKPAAVEHVHYESEGRPRYYEVHGYPVLDANGVVVQMIEYSLDITDRKLAQDRLELQAAELERSNEEFRQFAHIASHDLQEPLRMVSSYVHLLAERYRGRLDTDADEFIRFAVEGASRMRDLINGLLSYSRVGTHAKPNAPVDTDEAVSAALSNLEVSIRETGAILEIGPLPPVLGDITQITQVFQNLIANAIKFGSPDRKPVIRVSGAVRDGMAEFAVTDNGIGINPRYHERIFQIFQRLHTREEFPGTGIGLTICRKIVERHGGAIRLESAEGEGTTFYFTLRALDGGRLEEGTAPSSGEARLS